VRQTGLGYLFRVVRGADVVGCAVGLVGGVAVSTFSRSLALLIGLLVFGVQVSRLLRDSWIGADTLVTVH